MATSPRELCPQLDRRVSEEIAQWEERLADFDYRCDVAEKQVRIYRQDAGYWKERAERWRQQLIDIGTTPDSE